MIFFSAWMVGLMLNGFLVFGVARRRIALKKDSSAPPKLGGAVVAAAFAAGVFLAPRDLLESLQGVFLTLCGLAFAVGLADDVCDFSPFLKFLTQVVLAGAAVFGGIRTEIVFLPLSLNVLFSIFWFLALMNAFNLLDILDGLAGGIAALCAGAFWYIGANASLPAPAVLCAALTAGNLVFFLLNFPRARLYLGESGSLFNGFLLAAVAMMPRYAHAGGEAALAVPLLILALPLFDLFFVIVMRLKRGRSVIRKSRDHFVLRLAAMGLPPSRIVFLMLGLNSLFAGAALLLLRLPNTSGYLLIAAAVAIWFVIATEVSRVKIDER